MDEEGQPVRRKWTVYSEYWDIKKTFPMETGEASIPVGME